MTLFSNLLALLITAVIVVTVTARATGVAQDADSMEPARAVAGLHRVLSQPTVREVHHTQAISGGVVVELDLDWSSTWRGGPAPINGTLFLTSSCGPEGVAVACVVDPASLAIDPHHRVQIHIDSQDPAVAAFSSVDDIEVRFNPRGQLTRILRLDHR
jgi:hypothetical protein